MIKNFALLALLSLVLTGCIAPQKKPVQDLSAYKAHMPRSILVLPPINDSPDVKAYYGYWSTVNLPVAESGYYVFPMSLVEKMFKENGISNGYDAQSVSADKLHQIFGADAALYIKIKEYGTSYKVIDSQSVVAAEAKLVDLKTGTELWQAKQKLVQSSNSGNNNLIAAMVGALISQVSNSLNDRAHQVSASVNNLMFYPDQAANTVGRQGMGLLYGPRSPNYQPDSNLSEQNSNLAK